MKANEFVKEFGWEESKKVISRWGATGYFCREVKVFKARIVNSFRDVQDEFHTISLSELSSLVESHELVEKHGGLEKAKGFVLRIEMLNRQLENSKMAGSVDAYSVESFERLKQAIADVESCGGMA